MTRISRKVDGSWSALGPRC